VIPCLNEAGRIGPVVEGARARLGRVLVVDDGSTDGTAAEARQAGAEVIRHERPLGKGRSLREGCAWSVGKGAGWAVCLDGDGQHLPTDIPVLVEAALRTGADLVVGNRFAEAAAMPWLRRATNRAMSGILGGLAGRPLPDSQCGFRAVRLARWAELRLVTDGFEIESEMLLAAVHAGWKVEFAPIRTVYRGERSKIRPVTDGWRWWRWVFSRARPRARSGSRTGR